jgi:hypothetical protein
MNAIVRVVRIYGSTAQYRSEDQPMPEPLEAANYPNEGDTLRVWFGAVPEDMSHHLQVLVATGNTRLNAIVGGQRGDDDVIAAALEKVIAEDQVALNELWYVTLAVDRPVMLPDDALLDHRFEWINADAVEAPEDELRPVAAQAIDMAVAAMAPLAPNPLVSGRVLARSYVFAHDREATSALRLTGRARGIGVHSLSALPLGALRDRIAALPERQDWQPFQLAAHWYEAMLQEEEDDLKRFLWGFIALETLTETLYDGLYDVAVAALHMDANGGASAPHQNLLAIVRLKNRLGLADRFSVVSGYLSPATASDDSTKFRALKEARDAIGHGSSRRESLSFPTEHLIELLPRYFELALNADH